MPIDGRGTESVEVARVPPVPGMQKLPRQVGKRFRDCLLVAPEKKAKRPAGLKKRPA
jgi:hypothetical protein